MGRRKKKLWTHLDLDSPFFESYVGVLSHLTLGIVSDFDEDHHEASGSLALGSGGGTFDGALDGARHVKIAAHLKDMPLSMINPTFGGVGHLEAHIEGPNDTLASEVILQADQLENALFHMDRLILKLKSANLLSGGTLEFTADQGQEEVRVGAEGAWDGQALQLKALTVKAQGLSLEGEAGYAFAAPTFKEGIHGHLSGTFSDFSGLGVFLKGVTVGPNGQTAQGLGQLKLDQKLGAALKLRLSGAALHVHDFFVDALEGQITWDWLQGAFPEGRLHARGMAWGETLLVDRCEISSTLQKEGGATWGLSFGTPLGGEGRLKGTWERGRAAPIFTIGQANFHQKAIGDVPALDIALEAPWRLFLGGDNTRFSEAHVRVNEGVLALQEAQDQTVNIRVQQLPLVLGTLVRDVFPWRGEISGTMTIQHHETPDVSWKMQIDGLVNSEALNVTTKETEVLTLTTQGSWKSGILKGFLQVNDATREIAKLVLDVPDDLFYESGHMGDATGSLTLSLDGEIGPLVQIFLGSSGRLEGVTASRIKATLRRHQGVWTPTLEGAFDLHNGLLEDFNTNLSLDALNAHVDAQGTQFSGLIKGRDRSGGSLDVTLKAGWPKASVFHLEADLDLVKFNAMQTDTLSITATGHIQALLNTPAVSDVPALKLSGALDILRGGYALEQLQVQDFPTLDVVSINVPLGIRDDLKGEGGAGFSAGLDLHLTVPNTLSIDGFGMTSVWGGALDVLGTTEAPILKGTLKLSQGTFSIMARELALKEGTVIFHEQTPINPDISIMGTMTGGGVTTSVTLSGSANAPHLELSSTPPMSESEIVSHILFGTNSGEITPLQAVLLANTLQEIHSGHFGGGLFASLRKATGLDDLSFSTNEEGEGMVGIGKYLGNGVYMSVKGGLGAGEASVEVPLSEHISATTALGTNGNTGIGLNWTWSY